jgi:catechol 2,3-dioxygenase-like lactoylglutathione lyase family enzyme
MIIGFDHTSFTVADLDAALRFWTALGFDGPGIATRDAAWVPAVTGVPGARIRVAHLHGHGHHLEFIEYAGGGREPQTALPDRPGVGHVCLRVSDIHRMHATMLAAGGSRLGEMTEIRQPGMKPCIAGYMRDPNGIIVELLELLDA